VIARRKPARRPDSAAPKASRPTEPRGLARAKRKQVNALRSKLNPRQPAAPPSSRATFVSSLTRALLVSSLTGALLVSSLLLSACGRGEVSNGNAPPRADASPAASATRGGGDARGAGGDVAPPAQATAETPAPTAGQTNAGEDGGDSGAEFVGTTGVVEVKSKGGGVATLAGVRVARHEGYDRVVFEFRQNVLPGYRVEYAGGAVRRCGSGEAARVAGGARLEVTFTPARAHDDEGRATVGPREQSFDHAAVKQLLNTCDFEAELTWAVGVASRNDYRVRELSGPPRLVIDIRH
jgi:hypothetical protein